MEKQWVVKCILGVCFRGQHSDNLNHPFKAIKPTAFAVLGSLVSSSIDHAWLLSGRRAPQEGLRGPGPGHQVPGGHLPDTQRP